MNAAGEAPMTGTPSPGFFLFSYVCAATVKISELDGFFLLRFAATFTCPYNGKAERASVLCFFFARSSELYGEGQGDYGMVDLLEKRFMLPFFLAVSPERVICRFLLDRHSHPSRRPFNQIWPAHSEHQLSFNRRRKTSCMTGPHWA